MVSKKKILIFSQWFYPAYKAGGPIQSVYNLVDQLSDVYNFHIVASDRDIFQTQALEGLTVNEWTTVNNIPVIYLTPDKQNKSNFEKIIKEEHFDAVYINSMFAIKYAFTPLWIAIKLNKQIILAPRGMLGDGAMKVGRFKKKLFIKVFKLLSLHKKIVWQATAQSEKEEIEDNFGKNLDIRIAPNLSKKMPDAASIKKKEVNHLKLFFLSRVAVKKNLLGALHILEKIPSNYTIEFDIIGPCEDKDYWNKCSKVIERLPNHIKVKNIGPIQNLDIPSYIKDYHFLFLPTFNENFGHVIMEAWQQACPVIISDQTPWKGLKEKCIGWEFPLTNTEDFINAINYASEMDIKEFSQWSESAFEYAKKFCEDDSLQKLNVDLFS